MNILVISKSYHERNFARPIQMRRVITAISTNTTNKIILLTEGEDKLNCSTKDLQIINILTSKKKYPLIGKIIDRIICNSVCLKTNTFIKRAIEISIGLISEGKVDLLMTVSFPSDAHLVGLSIKNEFPEIKWVTFFSDIWPTSLLPHPYYRRKLLSTKEIAIMKSIMQKCDGLLTPSSYTLDILAEKFETKAQMATVPHCTGDEVNSSNSLKGYLVHCGLLHKERIHIDLISAIKELGEEEPNFKGLLQIGRHHPVLNKLINEMKCNNIFLLGKIPEELSSLIQGGIDISLIIEAPMRDRSPFVPSKIADSIYLSKKLIVITPPKSFIRDLASGKKGFFCCTYDKKEIKRCIKEAIISNEEIDDKIIRYFKSSNVAQLYNTFFQSLT